MPRKKDSVRLPDLRTKHMGHWASLKLIPPDTQVLSEQSVMASTSHPEVSYY